MTSVHFVLALPWDQPEEPLTFTYTDGTEARAAYDELRNDPTIKHARLYHNPTPNGGVYDGAPPQPPVIPDAATDALPITSAELAAASLQPETVDTGSPESAGDPGGRKPAPATTEELHLES